MIPAKEGAIKALPTSPKSVLQVAGVLFQAAFHGYLPISMAEACTFQGLEFGKYHLYQGKTPHCADTAIAMLCRMRDDAAGGGTGREAGMVSDYLDILGLGRDASGGTTFWGLNRALNHFGIPYSFRLFGTLKRIDRALEAGKIILVSRGRVFLRRWPPGIDPVRTWGHVFLIVGSEGEQYRLLDPAAAPGSGITRLGKTELMEQWWHSPIHPMWVIGREDRGP